MTKIAVRGISQRHGSADPDPDPPQNVMDPQHWSPPRLGGYVQQGAVPAFEVLWRQIAASALHDGVAGGIVLCSSSYQQTLGGGTPTRRHFVISPNG